jgi:ABC-type sugar transport system permease subunit
MDAVKVFLSFIFGSFLAMLDPIKEPIAILVILFTLDIAGGVITDRVVHSRGFSFRKFFRSVMFLCMYVVVIASLYAVCYLQDDMEEGLTLLKAITYVCGYFYFSNIAKNLHETYPKNRFFSFLFYALSVDLITSRLPVLQKFLKAEKDGKDEQIKN